MTGFGDLAVSELDEMPKGRRRVETAVSSSARLETLLARLERRMDEGTGVFWVCPKVESRAPHQDDEASGPGRASSPRQGQRPQQDRRRGRRGGHG